MSTQAYDVGDEAELSFVVASTASTNPASGTTPRLVYTDPSGNDTVVTSGSFSTIAASELSEFTTLADSTSLGVAGWKYAVPLDEAGRWTYQWRSTGTVRTSEGGAFAVSRPMASTST